MPDFERKPEDIYRVFFFVFNLSPPSYYIECAELMFTFRGLLQAPLGLNPALPWDRFIMECGKGSQWT